MKARQKGKQNRKFYSRYKILSKFYRSFQPIPQEMINEMMEILKKAEENKLMDKYKSWIEQDRESGYTYNGPLCGPVK